MTTYNGVHFEWDARKARRNQQKHGISFLEAVTAFADPYGIPSYDPDHSEDEDRFLWIATAASGRVLAIIHTERGPTIRLISARLATRQERTQYAEGTSARDPG